MLIFSSKPSHHRQTGDAETGEKTLHLDANAPHFPPNPSSSSLGSGEWGGGCVLHTLSGGQMSSDKPPRSPGSGSDEVVWFFFWSGAADIHLPTSPGRLRGSDRLTASQLQLSSMTTKCHQNKAPPHQKTGADIQPGHVTRRGRTPNARRQMRASPQPGQEGATYGGADKLNSGLASKKQEEEKLETHRLMFVCSD